MGRRMTLESVEKRHGNFVRLCGKRMDVIDDKVRLVLNLSRGSNSYCHEDVENLAAKFEHYAEMIRMSFSRPDVRLEQDHETLDTTPDEVVEETL